MSGAGKTTIGQALYENLRKDFKNTVFLDGDVMRGIFDDIYGHTLEDRKRLAIHYGRLCRMLSEQGINVVCATISMFSSVRKWNRENIPLYKEIYIKVPMGVLIKRDQKQLYSRALKGEISNVMGVDVAIEEPDNPDLVVINDDGAEIEDAVEDIKNLFNTTVGELE